MLYCTHSLTQIHPVWGKKKFVQPHTQPDGTEQRMGHINIIEPHCNSSVYMYTFNTLRDSVEKNCGKQ